MTTHQRITKYKVGDTIELKFQNYQTTGVITHVFRIYRGPRYWVKWDRDMPWTEFDENSPVCRGTSLMPFSAGDFTDTYEID